MKKTLQVFTALLVLCAAGANGKDKSGRTDKYSKSDKGTKPAAGAQPDEKAEPAKGFDGFRNVRLKNIFDPSRRGMPSDKPATAQTSTSTHGRTLALTGTMVTNGKTLAFFGGSAAEGSKVVSVGTTVANFKLTAIAPTQVALEHDGKSLVLDVGRQLTLDGGGESSPAEPVVETPVQAPAETGAPNTAPVAGDKAEILRRMMERRAKEAGK